MWILERKHIYWSVYMGIVFYESDSIFFMVNYDFDRTRSNNKSWPPPPPHPPYEENNL